jgi:hypothetical protein
MDVGLRTTVAVYGIRDRASNTTTIEIVHSKSASTVLPENWSARRVSAVVDWHGTTYDVQRGDGTEAAGLAVADVTSPVTLLDRATATLRTVADGAVTLTRTVPDGPYVTTTDAVVGAGGLLWWVTDGQAALVQSLDGVGAPRIAALTSAAAADVDATHTDAITVSALAEPLDMGAVHGSPADMQKLQVRFRDNGTPQSITWPGSVYVERGGFLPTVTVPGQTIEVGLEWDAGISKWACIASATS